jgi:Asp/Glu/hydantoin racemase
MRIYAVTPIHVEEAELARRQARYREVSPPGLSVDLADIGPHAPRALETARDVQDSEALVVEALRRAPDGYDALMPDCVLDPGVAQLAGALSTPVIGILRISLGWSILTGRSTAAVARNETIASEILARVKVYGWFDSFQGVEVLKLEVDSIADTDRWAEALDKAVHRLGQVGVTHVINGCSAVDLPQDRAEGTVRVVDPTELALRLLASGGVQ